MKIPGKAQRLGVVFAAVGVTVLVTFVILHFFSRQERNFLPEDIVSDARIDHPADIVRFKGRYVAALLYENKLAVFDVFDPTEVTYFDPTTIGKRFKSPHFLSVTPDDTLLISNGWGSSIVEIEDLKGKGWREFRGVGKRLRAPHGICVDDSGWIYVGDSLNSRLVRFRNMDGDGWEVFQDDARRISYIRELVCGDDGALWISNSYEKREGLNPGKGSNVLRITDFESGMAEVVHSIPNTNITGLLPLAQDMLLVGLWGNRQRVALIDTRQGSLTEMPRLALGTPYGMFADGDTGKILITHFGELSDQPDSHPGGISIHTE